GFRQSRFGHVARQCGDLSDAARSVRAWRGWRRSTRARMCWAIRTARPAGVRRSLVGKARCPTVGAGGPPLALGDHRRGGASGGLRGECTPPRTREVLSPKIRRAGAAKTARDVNEVLTRLHGDSLAQREMTSVSIGKNCGPPL